MEAALLYLLKANVVLALFAAAYYGLLRRLTFFKLNRVYLLVALLFAAVYPALPVPALWPAAKLAALPVTPLVAPRLAQAVGPASHTPQLLVLGGALYAAGAGGLVLRLLVQLLSLALMRARSRAAVVLGQPVRLVPGTGGPFSFGGSIYLSAATLADAAGLPAVLHHEQAHVRQWHTLDVLLVQAATALAWPNPAAWLLRRAALDNLEYLADRAALQTGLDRRAYQYSLLHQQASPVPAPALAFHFSFLTLKNRILMLNQPASTTRQLGRYLLAAPLIMLLALGYSSAQAQVTPTLLPAEAKKPLLTTAEYYLDGEKIGPDVLTKLNPEEISYINIIKGAEQQQLFGSTAPDGTVVVTTKAKANTPAVLAFNQRINAVKPLTPASPEQEAAMQAIKGYLSKNYPNAKLSILGPAREKPGRYQAVFTEAGQRMQLLFDGDGQPVKQ